MNSLKNHEVPGVSLLNFEDGPGVLLLNFEGAPGPESQGPEVQRTAGMFSGSDIYEI